MNLKQKDSHNNRFQLQLEFIDLNFIQQQTRQKTLKSFSRFYFLVYQTF